MSGGVPGMPAVRALLVDDEEPGRINLRCALADSGASWRIAGECASAQQARAALAGGDVDVVFLDIRMPHESGLALARELAARHEPPLVIFVTAYDAHAVEAFEVHALDYLLKPVDDARLAQALRRAEAMLAQRQRAGYAQAMRDCLAPADGDPYWRRLGVRSVGRIDSIAVDDILWIDAAGNYVELHLPGRTVLHRITLAALEKRLDPAQFVRVHRGTIVRIAQLASLARAGDGATTLALRCGATVAVSERHVAAARALVERAE